MIKPWLDNMSSHGLIIHSVKPPHQRQGGGTSGGISPIAVPSGRAASSASVVSVRDDSADPAARTALPERAASPRRAASPGCTTLPGHAASPGRAASPGGPPARSAGSRALVTSVPADAPERTEAPRPSFCAAGEGPARPFDLNCLRARASAALCQATAASSSLRSGRGDRLHGAQPPILSTSATWTMRERFAHHRRTFAVRRLLRRQRDDDSDGFACSEFG